MTSRAREGITLEAELALDTDDHKAAESDRAELVTRYKTEDHMPAFVDDDLQIKGHKIHQHTEDIIEHISAAVNSRFLVDLAENSDQNTE